MEKTTFAFKLADRDGKNFDKWKTRDGVALAGCTDFGGDLRESKIRLDDWYYC